MSTRSTLSDQRTETGASNRNDASKTNVSAGSKNGSSKSNATTSDESWYFGTMSYFDPDFIEKKWQQRQKSRQKQKNEGNHWGIWELTRKGLMFKPKDAERYHKLIDKHHKKYGKKREIYRGLEEFISKTGSYADSSSTSSKGASQSQGRKKSPQIRTPTTPDSDSEQNSHVTGGGGGERLITLDDVKRVALTMLKMMLQKYKLGHSSNDVSTVSARNVAGTRSKKSFNDPLASDNDQALPELPAKLRTLVGSNESDLLCVCLLSYFHHYRLFISLPNSLFVRKNAPGVRQELMKLQSQLQLALIRLCRAFSNVLLSRGRFDTHKLQSNYPSCISLYLVNDRFLMESYYEYLFNICYVAFERKSGLELRGEFGRLFRTPAFNPFDVRRVMQDLRNYIEYTLQAKAMARQLNAASRLEASKKLAAASTAAEHEEIGGRSTAADNDGKSKAPALKSLMSPRAKLSKRQADKLFLLANAGVPKPKPDASKNGQNEVDVVEEVLQFVKRKRFHSRKVTRLQRRVSSSVKTTRRLRAMRNTFGLRRRRSSMYWPMVTGARAAKSEEQLILEKASLWRSRFRYRHSAISDYPAMQSAWYTSPVISAMYSEKFTTAMRQMCAEHLHARDGEDGKTPKRRQNRLISMRGLYTVINELVSLPLDSKIGIIGKPIKCYYGETLLPQENDDEKAFSVRSHQQQQDSSRADSKAGTPTADGNKSSISPTIAAAADGTPTTAAAADNNAVLISPAAAAMQASRALSEHERQRERNRIADLVMTIYDMKYRGKSIFDFFTPAEPKLPPTPRPEIAYDIVYGGDPADSQWVERWVSRPAQYPLFRRTHTEEEERLHRYFMQQQQRENAFYEQVLEYQTQDPPPSHSSSPVDRVLHDATSEGIANDPVVRKLATALVNEVTLSVANELKV